MRFGCEMQYLVKLTCYFVWTVKMIYKLNNFFIKLIQIFVEFSG